MKTTNQISWAILTRGFTAAALIFGLGACKKEDDNDDNGDPQTQMEMYSYEFNNGQVVASAAYDGPHSDKLMAELKVESKSDGGATITVTLTNTVDGATYPVHAHDAADPGTTPNGTPYDETPNGNLLVATIDGNGGEASVSVETDMSFDEITNSYEGFFVVHDPLQTISTVDISTYLAVGTFARDQGSTNLKSQSFSYDFNTGQIDPSLAYSGSHPGDLEAMINLQELVNGETRVSVALMNSLDGESYPVHAHDKADPSTTPNGTPYDESPNGNVLIVTIDGNGGTAHASQHSSMGFDSLTNSYEAFFVVHDPLQPVNTADPTTYVVLGDFAR